MLKQTLTEYMNNPAGKGSTVIPNRQLIIDDYKRRYEKIKEHHKFEVTIYKNGDDYLFHVLVPSEDKDKNISYDVVIQFTMLDKDLRNEITVNNYYVKFFSNCPSFVYTFAHTYYKNDILVEGFESKYRDEVLDEAPKTRNPQQMISFEKSVYFACLHIMSSPSFRNKLYLNSHARSLNIKTLLKKVRTSDAILIQYKKEKSKTVTKDSKKPITKSTPKPERGVKKTQAKPKKSSTNRIEKRTASKKITAKKTTSKGKK